jgi:glycosyltransferase involved in cell wall biosynthesis
MKIAIIAYGFSENSIPLCYHLARNSHAVDFFFITGLHQQESSGFNFNKAPHFLGIHRLTEKETPEISAYFKNAPVSLNLIRLNRASKYLKLFNKLIIRHTVKDIRKSNYDIINIIGQNELLIEFHKHLQGYNKVHTLHEVYDHCKDQKVSDPLLKYLFDKNIRIIVHSTTSYERILQYSNCNVAVVHIIPLGLFESYLYYNAAEFEEFGSKNILLFFGFILPYKGLDILVEAVDLLQNEIPDLKVIIAGFGNDPALKKTENNSRYLVFNRYLSTVEIVALNKCAKAIVCPYKSASQSGIIMTALLFGKPIIASSVGAFRETIIDGINGLLVNPGSPEDLSIAIKRVFKDPELYNKLVAGAEDFPHTTIYNWEYIVVKTLDVFKLHNLD